MVESLQEPLDPMQIRVRLRGILADHIERREVATVHRVEHLGEVPAMTRLNRRLPGALELRARLVIENVLEAGQAIRDCPHVPAALDVVLSAQRVQPATVPSNLARQQREVDQREDVVHRVVVLRDAESPADHRAVGTRIGERRVADGVARNPGFLLRVLERVFLHARAVLVEIRRRAPDEFLVRQPCVDDHAGHGVGERDVAADLETEPDVRPRRRAGATRIHNVQTRAGAHAFQDMMEENRMSIARVRAPEEDDVRLFHFLIRARAATRPEDRRQTDDARSVSRPIAAVDVVVAERHPGQLTRQKIHLVRRLRAAEDSERVCTARREVPAKSLGGHIQCFVPRGCAKGAVLTHERLRQASI